MSIANKYRPQFTYDDYLLWEGRWELIDGMPYPMSPAPGPYHQTINGNLYTTFRGALRNGCADWEVFFQLTGRLTTKQ